MTIIQAIILGTVQGLTEFLPISSSAHLNLFPWLLKWQEMPESFDVALHIGTLLAIIVYFFKDWIRLIAGGYKQVVKKEKTTDGKIFWYLVIATVPAGILSLILDKIVDEINYRLVDQGISITLTDKCKDYVVANSYDKEYGARPIKRYVSHNIETLLANSIVNGTIKPNSKLVIDVKNDEFTIN